MVCQKYVDNKKVRTVSKTSVEGQYDDLSPRKNRYKYTRGYIRLICENIS